MDHAPPRTARLAAIDDLRGLVVVLMALDHARHFLAPEVDPLDLSMATPAWFLVRWITHLCAPGFVFLAGLSAALFARRAGGEAAGRFLLTRGIWLILLEVTAVNFAWQFSFHSVSLLVIWALGGSMICLALLAGAHRGAPLAAGAALTLGLGLLGGLRPSDFGPAQVLAGLLVVPHAFFAGSLRISVAYPLLPWLGVMALGWGLAPWLVPERRIEWRRAAALGAVLIAAFVLLRAVAGYGEPRPWLLQERGAAFSALAFVDCTKYPPSLQFLLMTLGPLLLLLALLDLGGGRLTATLRIFGRVPLFFYLLHIPLAHVCALAWEALAPGLAVTPSLSVVVGGWLVLLAVLWPACRAWGRLKERRSWPWLRYL